MFMECSYTGNSELRMAEDTGGDDFLLSGLQFPVLPEQFPVRRFPIPCFSLLFMVTSRDRIAPNCLIRHPVLQIVALKRRVRFFARLAGFGRGRCHQRRARRAEEASFSVFVSNLYFRLPRLRQRGGAGR